MYAFCARSQRKKEKKKKVSESAHLIRRHPLQKNVSVSLKWTRPGLHRPGPLQKKRPLHAPQQSMPRRCSRDAEGAAGAIFNMDTENTSYIKRPIPAAGVDLIPSPAFAHIIRPDYARSTRYCPEHGSYASRSADVL